MFKASPDHIFTNIINKLNNLSLDRETIPFDKLDLTNRIRTNLFPWRGQFSPELIELLLNTYAKKDYTILDPFAGSGTTLIEASRKCLTCFGAEINPAAIEMARTVHFTGLNISNRENYINKARYIIEEYLQFLNGNDLFYYDKKGDKADLSEYDVFSKMIKDSLEDQFIYNIIINTIFRYFTIRNINKPRKIKMLIALNHHTNIIKSLPYCEKACRVYQCDARSLPLESETIDLVITSPPYINVFNYHQYYREVMEIAGWNLLKIAKSEIGSNRKNRGNRFLTVIQYSIDMMNSLIEMRRVISKKGKAIIVIGRESKVRGISFENYKIISVIAIGGAGLELSNRQERKFTNRFGEKIYEDLLHLIPKGNPVDDPTEFARSAGIFILNEALNRADKDVRRDIECALEISSSVNRSPIFKPMIWGKPYEYHTA